MFKRKRKRLREINIDELERIRLSVKLSKKDVADMLCISQSQMSNYYRCGFIGADKFYAIINSLRAQIEEEANDRRNQLNEMIGTQY